MNIAISGIHTGIGKTVTSAVMCQALGYDYWKPVQAGDLNNSDSVFVQSHISNNKTTIHPERYKLQIAASPHYAAEQEGITIKKEDFVLPNTSNNLIVETAGGLMSPLANNFLIIDLIQHLNLPTILVSNNYLGSINHTLLSVAALNASKIKVLGIVFVGEKNPATESYILNHTQLPLLFGMPTFANLDKQTVTDFASTLQLNF